MSATNEVTGKPYQGKNVLRLLAAECEHGYSEDHGWAGYGQWQSAGRQVRKGEHGVRIVQIGCSATENADGTKSTRTHPVAGRPVFHYDQTVEVGAEIETKTEPDRCHGHDLPGSHVCTDLCTVNECCTDFETVTAPKTADASALVARLSSMGRA